MDNKWIQKFEKVRVTIAVTRDIDYIVNVADPSDLTQVKAAMRDKDAADWEYDPLFYGYLGDSYRAAVERISSENISQTDECSEVLWDLKILKTCKEQYNTNTQLNNKIDGVLGEVMIECDDDLDVIGFRVTHQYNKNIVRILSSKPKEFTDTQWKDLVNTLKTFISNNFMNKEQVI